MRSFAARSAETEWMDGEDVAPDVYAACVHDLGRVNTVTRTRPPTLRWLAAATERMERFSLLDVGYGDGDMLRAVAAWARRQGTVAALTGIDINPRSEPAARAATSPGLGIDFRTGDAFNLPGRPDFIVSSQVTHHMGDAEIVRFLRWMEATAVRGWFVGDLHRHWIAYWGFRALSWAARWHSFVRHDGPVSVARSFRRADWERLIALAGIDRNAVTIRWHVPFRLCVGRVK
jgi:2-polyprenyl-3-methyl-5-hydroxy-6-metoxy-1,4-benzoquinol methylase